jgi:hypothetical protein
VWCCCRHVCVPAPPPRITLHSLGCALPQALCAAHVLHAAREHLVSLRLGGRRCGPDADGEQHAKRHGGVAVVRPAKVGVLLGGLCVKEVRCVREAGWRRRSFVTDAGFSGAGFGRSLPAQRPPTASATHVAQPGEASHAHCPPHFPL